MVKATHPRVELTASDIRKSSSSQNVHTLPLNMKNNVFFLPPHRVTPKKALPQMEVRQKIQRDSRISSHSWVGSHFGDTGRDSGYLGLSLRLEVGWATGHSGWLIPTPVA